MKKGVIKTLKILLNVIIGLIIIVAAVVTIVSLSTRENGVADVNGYIPFSIQTASMEPTIKVGDLIITKKYDDQKLKVGDIISFASVEQEKTIIKTHRIKEINTTGDLTSYVTKGDNNEAIDEVEVAPGDIIAVYDGTKYAHLGTILDFFKSKYGFLFCIILPLFIFFLYQLYSFITLIIEVKKDKAIKEINDASKKA